jgi:predicted nucleic acid-binding protein
MPWVVDTCLLIDIAENDPAFAADSTQLVSRRHPDGLVICPLTLIEIAPLAKGDLRAAARVLQSLGIAFREPWRQSDTAMAFTAWDRHIALKRRGMSRKRPVADILIGAFALRFQGLLTRNPDDFRPIFPTLRIVTP